MSRATLKIVENGVSKLKDWGMSGEINYDFGAAKLTSITAYRDYKSRDYGDYDYNRADIVYRDPNTYRQFKTFTQELRLQGKAFEDKLDWLVGGYYSNEKLTLVDNIRFGRDYGLFATCRILATPTNAALLPCNSRAAMQAGVINANFPTGGGGAPALLNAALSNLLSIGATGTAGDNDARYRQNEGGTAFVSVAVPCPEAPRCTLASVCPTEILRAYADLYGMDEFRAVTLRDLLAAS